MEKVKTLAQQISSNLYVMELASGNKYRTVWKDEAPEELKEWFRDLSGKVAENSLADLDECYRVLDDLCDLIVDQMDENSTPEDLEEAITTREWASVYNVDRIDWLAENMERAEAVDEAIKEGAEGVFDALGIAIDRSRADMALQFAAAMVERTA